MAIYKPSALVAQVSGTIGGGNFVAGKRSIYVRAPRLVRSATSKAQLDRQVSMGVLTNAWNALTSAQQTGWNTIAASSPVPNRLGIPIVLNGREFFFKRGLTNRTFGIVGYYTTPPIPIQTPSSTAFVMTNPSAGNITATFANSLLPAVLLNAFYGARSLGHTHKRNFYNWKAIASFTNNATSYNIGPDFYDDLGQPAAGEVIAVRMFNRKFNGADAGYLDSGIVQADLTMVFP